VNRRTALLAFAVAFLGVGFFSRTPDTGGVALRDFEAYYAAGSTWRYHGNPYGREIWRAERQVPGVVATREELLPFVGPPFGLPLWDALSRLPWGAAVGVWRAVMFLSFAAIVLGSLRFAAGKLTVFDACAALVLGATFAPLTSGVALGQVALPACAAIVVTPLLLRVRYAYAAALGAFVAALQPNLAVSLIARLREPRSLIGATAAVALVVGGSAVAMQDLGGIGEYLRVLRQHAGSESDAAIQTTIAGTAYGLGVNLHTAGLIAFYVALAAIGVLAVQCFSRRYSPDDCLVLACAALPLAMPFAHEHDFCIAFLPAAVLAYRSTGTARALGVVATIAIAVDWLGLAQRPGSTLEACAFALAAGLAFAALAAPRIAGSGAPSRSSSRVTGQTAGIALAGALCVALVAIPAASHRLPTWPDRLPANFAVSRFMMGAPDVWHEEQAISGVTGRDPYWALLRCFSLAGCATLWGVAGVVLSGSRSSEPLSTSARPRPAIYPSA
jgi:hypothetical protein